MLGRSFAFLLLSAFFMGLLGCATQVPMSDEDAVLSRAQGWLDALLDEDYAAAHAYTSPGFRTRESAPVYRKRYAGSSMWLSGEVKSATCEDDSCQVKSKVEYKIKGMGLTGSLPMTETWVKVDGKWWLYHKK